MKEPKKTNMAESVRRRLLNLSEKTGEDFQYILTKYGLERFLYRLGNSTYAEQFILKGAMLFSIWLKKTYRPTRDMDFLAFGKHTRENLEKIMQDVIEVPVPDDGLVFDKDTIVIQDIREQHHYAGQRTKIKALLGKTIITLQIDIGYGDVVSSQVLWSDFPAILDFPAPHIRIYPKETVIAEKLEAIISLGSVNSRMKDFYDIYMMSQLFSFQGTELVESVKKTFHRRNTNFPEDIPVGLGNSFINDSEKNKQWLAFLGNQNIEGPVISFENLIKHLREFCMPIITAAKADELFELTWDNINHWHIKYLL